MVIKDSYAVIGLMSGTSLDGLDIAHCKFHLQNGRWEYQIGQTITVPYEESLREKLGSAIHMDAVHLKKLDNELGRFFGFQLMNFMKQLKEIPDFISSHGHTVFHQPDDGYTLQIGNAWCMKEFISLPIINDFRSIDVALGGQGAPLVPIGDDLLFSDFDYCLNLGGFMNISFKKNNRRLARDICPLNTVFNMLAGKLGKDFDEGGEIGAQGQVLQDLLSNLNAIPHYQSKGPASLGMEWLNQEVLPLIKTEYAHQDVMRTFQVHAADKLSEIIKSEGDSGKLLLSGGGVYNDALLKEIKKRLKLEVVVPNKQLIQFKEALIFAFLGVLKWRGEINVLASVTGASKDSSSGCIYLSVGILCMAARFIL